MSVTAQDKDATKEFNSVCSALNYKFKCRSCISFIIDLFYY